MQRNNLEGFFDARPRHKSKDGSEIFIEEMTDGHLVNTLKCCIMVDTKTNKIDRYTSRGHLYLKEMKRRGLDTTNLEVGAIYFYKGSNQNEREDYRESEGDWGGLYGEEAEAGYWNTH